MQGLPAFPVLMTTWILFSCLIQEQRGLAGNTEGAVPACPTASRAAGWGSRVVVPRAGASLGEGRGHSPGA